MSFTHMCDLCRFSTATNLRAQKKPFCVSRGFKYFTVSSLQNVMLCFSLLFCSTAPSDMQHLFVLDVISLSLITNPSLNVSKLISLKRKMSVIDCRTFKAIEKLMTELHDSIITLFPIYFDRRLFE